MRPAVPIFVVFWFCALACTAHGQDISYARTGTLHQPHLDELSGLQASRRHAGVLWTHNDDTDALVFGIDSGGKLLGTLQVPLASNRDWEDIALLPMPDGDLLVLADLGDNGLKRGGGKLWFVTEPQELDEAPFNQLATLHHVLTLRWPDGSHDVEAVAYDPLGNRLLFLDKRSQPPRLYGLDRDQALAVDEAEPEFLAEIRSFRPPQLADRRRFGQRTAWISQPTGMDISADGQRAAVITYRSLYLFDLASAENWVQGLQSKATEIIGPPAEQAEAVGFATDQKELYVVSEGRNAPVYTFRLMEFP
jgi:hypothetical protein